MLTACSGQGNVLQILRLLGLPLGCRDCTTSAQGAQLPAALRLTSVMRPLSNTQGRPAGTSRPAVTRCDTSWLHSWPVRTCRRGWCAVWFQAQIAQGSITGAVKILVACLMR